MSWDAKADRLFVVIKRNRHLQNILLIILPKKIVQSIQEERKYDIFCLKL